jgi:hypothetical protein
VWWSRWKDPGFDNLDKKFFWRGGVFKDEQLAIAHELAAAWVLQEKKEKE